GGGGVIKRRIAVVARRQLRENEVGTRGVARRRQRAGGKHDGTRGIAEQPEIDADAARETCLLRTVGGERPGKQAAIVREQRKLLVAAGERGHRRGDRRRQYIRAIRRAVVQNAQRRAGRIRKLQIGRPERGVEL